MKKRFLIPFLSLFLLLALPASAMDLQAARAAGIVGEKADGYVAVIKASPEAADLAREVNARRAEEYKRISKENGQPVSIVGQIAAEQIINNLPAGAKYQDAGGAWKTR